MILSHRIIKLNGKKINFWALFGWKAGNQPKKKGVLGEKGKRAKEGIYQAGFVNKDSEL